MKEIEVKKTIGEWSREFEVIVADPDGFDGTNPNLFEELFTISEFMNGLIASTVSWWGNKRHETFTEQTERIKKKLNITE